MTDRFAEGWHESSHDSASPSNPHPEQLNGGWDPDAALNAAVQEREILEISVEEQGNKLLQDSLVPAILSIGWLSRHSPNEKVRLDASKYIVDRNLGKVGESTTTKAGEGDKIESFEDFVRSLVVSDEAAHAKADQVRQEAAANDDA